MEVLWRENVPCLFGKIYYHIHSPCSLGKHGFEDAFALRNVGLKSTSDLTATLLGGNGVVSPSGPQSYGVLIPGGSSASGTFTFTASGQCGDGVLATMQLQDGSLNLGVLTFPLILGQPASVFTQSFDTVVAPALPAGWTTTSSGSQFPWITAVSAFQTAPNAMF